MNPSCTARALLLLHVIDLPTAIKPDTVIVPDATGAPVNVREYAVASAEAHLEDIVARLAKDGVTATPFIRVGNPVDEIARFVEEEKVSLVVMGTHGRTGLQHLLVGSVAERVVRTATCPVLTVRTRSVDVDHRRDRQAARRDVIDERWKSCVRHSVLAPAPSTSWWNTRISHSRFARALSTHCSTVASGTVLRDVADAQRGASDGGNSSCCAA